MSDASTPPVLGLPLVVGGGTDAVAPPDLVDGAAGIGLLQDRHDLISVNVDWRMRTSWIGVAIVPDDSPFGLSTFEGSLRGHHF
jgi:hypothetical protein